MRDDLLTIHEKVIRAMKHLIKDFDVDLETIRAFNTRGTLSSFEYVKNGSKRRKTRKTRKNRKI